MTSRIKLRLGDLELEYEGDPKVLTSELPKLLKAISEVPQAAPIGAGGELRKPKPLHLSVTTAAQKLNAHKLPDLILAAAFTLSEKGDGSFAKKELRAEMRGATGYWKAAMATNFDKTLNRLVKAGRVTHSGGTIYALPSTERQSLAGRLK